MKCSCCNYEGEFEKIVVRDSECWECDYQVRTEFYKGKYKYGVELYGCPKCGTVKFIKK